MRFWRNSNSNLPRLLARRHLPGRPGLHGVKPCRSKMLHGVALSKFPVIKNSGKSLSEQSAHEGGFMSLHYQVYADFEYTQGKRLLIRTSIFSTHAACTAFPFWPYENTCLTVSRIFPSLSLAHSYIAFLHRVYPDSSALPPVLDGGQLYFFMEVSK